MAPPPALRPLVVVATGSVDVRDELRRLLEASGVDVVDAGGDATAEAPAAAVAVADLDLLPTLPTELRTAPVLALVRRDELDDLVAAVASGAHDVLPLPFVAAEVQARVAGALRLSAAEAALQSRNAELVAWAHRAGHDLMTPLAVISGMAETLEAAWDRLPEADRARVLASIRNQAARAITMLEEAVALARGPAGGTGAEEPSPEG